jgi:hypothetical protein
MALKVSQFGVTLELFMLTTEDKNIRQWCEVYIEGGVIPEEKSRREPALRASRQPYIESIC